MIKNCKERRRYILELERIICKFMSLPQLVDIMYIICDVWGSNPDHKKKNIICYSSSKNNLIIDVHIQ